MRQAIVKINRKRVGVLTETDEGRFIFQYDEGWLSHPDSMPVSLTLPLRREAYTSDYLFPYFYAMLSEGANRAAQCTAFRIDPTDDFGLLLATASVDTIGNVTVDAV